MQAKFCSNVCLLIFPYCCAVNISLFFRFQMHLQHQHARKIEFEYSFIACTVTAIKKREVVIDFFFALAEAVLLLFFTVFYL